MQNIPYTLRYSAFIKGAFDMIEVLLHAVELDTDEGAYTQVLLVCFLHFAYFFLFICLFGMFV